MKTGIIIIISIVALFIIVMVMQNQARQRELLLQQQQAGGGGFINTACKDNWLCATSTILGGLGGILQGVNFGSGSTETDPGAGDLA